MSRQLGLAGQTLVVIGGSSGSGLETARRARVEGAHVILTAREPDRLHAAGLELGGSIAAFDATDSGRLARFFDELPGPVDHVLVTGPVWYYASPEDLDVAAVRRTARAAASKVRPGGTLLLMCCGGDGGPLSAALPALISDLASELAPVRVHLIAAGSVDTSVGSADITTLAVQLMTNTAVNAST